MTLREHSLAELGIQRDEDGQLQPGFQVGRAAALAEWEFRKQLREDRKLFARLYSRNWARRLRERDPERAREYCRKWRRENPERSREVERERMRRKRRAWAKLNPCTCEECGATWLPCDGRKRGRWCSKACANRWHGRKRAAKRNRGIRRMGLRDDIKAALRAEAWLTPAQLRERLGASGNVVTMCPRMVEDGELVRRKVKGCRAYQYALPGGG